MDSKTNLKTAIIDIDNTLWDFASVLYERLKLHYGNYVPPPSQWDQWDFWKEICPANEFFKIVRDIHYEQNRFGVYPDAREFLTGLKALGFKIIIASHREPDTYQPTVRWLQKHGLVFDELYLGNDKIKLLSFPLNLPGWCVCVDDSPQVLLEAKSRGIVATGLRFPWNREVDVELCLNLKEVLDFINDSSFPEMKSHITFL
jgi:hypothetical protein